MSSIAIASIATFAFVATSLSIALCRAYDIVNAHERAMKTNERNVTHYVGATFNRHGNEIY